VVNDAGLNFAASTVGGNLAATATTGNMTDSGALTIAGTSSFTTSANNATIALNTTTNAFTGAVTITTNDDSGTDADVTIDGGTTALVLAASTIDGDLTVRSGNASGIADNEGTVTVGGNLAATTDANNGVINLTALAVNGTIAVVTNGAGGATVVNDAGLNLAASTVGGNLLATATTGNITDSGTLTIAGASTFITGASGSNIILDSSGNAFSNAVTLQADAGNETFGNITFVDSGAVRLHSSAGANGDLYINAATDAAVGGNLNVTATTGNITQGRAVTVGGTSSFTTSQNNADITLNNANNAFTGAITLSTTGSSAHANIDGGTTALNIAASSVGGNLYLRTGNNITDSGTVTVGYGLVATTDDNNGLINLGDPGGW